MKIILASNSPRRKELLSKIVKDFDIIPSSFDESSVNEKQPSKLVKILAEAKGEKVFERLSTKKDIIIISSDTIVFFKRTSTWETKR